jgi:hypothetical protein
MTNVGLLRYKAAIAIFRAGWMLAECMFQQVEVMTLEIVRSATFISLSSSRTWKAMESHRFPHVFR